MTFQGRTEKGEKAETSAILPQEVQLYVDGFINKVIEMEKQGYDSKLMPFAHKQEELKVQAQEFFSTLHHKLKQGQVVLKAQFELQDKLNPKAAKDTTFAIWEQAREGMQKKMQDPKFSFSQVDESRPLQEQLQLPWAFMNRAYQTANDLLQEKKYEEAESVYMFLCFLHPGVFEYWLCSATCKQELGKLDEALNTYAMSLLWEPTNPLVFFQIASCYYQEKEQGSCLKAIEVCIEYATQDEKYASVLKEATEVKRALDAQKTA